MPVTMGTLGSFMVGTNTEFLNAALTVTQSFWGTSLSQR